eukprot:Skav228587  [mRNA]  locus=scaffold1470:209824:212686:- [translate_table: standard]
MVGSQLLNEVSIVQDGAEYYTASDADNEDLHALLSTLQAFVAEDTFKHLQECQDEKSQLASKLLSSLAFLRLFVERLQKADAAERQFDAAADSIRAERRRWLAGEAADLSKIEDGVAQAESAVLDLESTGMKSDVLDEVIESARSNLKEMKDEEHRRQTREIAGKALEAAMTSSTFDSKVCEQTAKDAHEAGCLPSAALEIAERVTNVNHESIMPKLHESIDKLSLLSVESVPRSVVRQPEDYVSAAVSAKASMTENQLIEHIAHLAEALATQHQREALELSGAWAAISPEWQRSSQEKGAELWSHGDDPQQRVTRVSSSAATTLRGDAAGGSGEELRRAFHGALPELMAAAFEPVEHGGGRGAGYLGGFVGQIFGRLYRIKGEQVELSLREHLESKLGALPVDEGSSVQRNLRLLAEALSYVDRGEMRQALTALDGLVGQCRSRAAQWISLTRQTLLSQQQADAARARMLCLGTTLEHAPHI